MLELATRSVDYHSITRLVFVEDITVSTRYNMIVMLLSVSGAQAMFFYCQETLKKALTASLRLSLTSDIRIEPTQASIFNHPWNKV